MDLPCVPDPTFEAASAMLSFCRTFLRSKLHVRETFAHAGTLRFQPPCLSCEMFGYTPMSRGSTCFAVISRSHGVDACCCELSLRFFLQSSWVLLGRPRWRRLNLSEMCAVAIRQICRPMRCNPTVLKNLVIRSWVPRAPIASYLVWFLLFVQLPRRQCALSGGTIARPAPASVLLCRFGVHSWHVYCHCRRVGRHWKCTRRSALDRGIVRSYVPTSHGGVVRPSRRSVAPWTSALLTHCVLQSCPLRPFSSSAFLVQSSVGDVSGVPLSEVRLLVPCGVRFGRSG